MRVVQERYVRVNDFELSRGKQLLRREQWIEGFGIMVMMQREADPWVF